MSDDSAAPVLSLIYAPGARPDVAAVREAGAQAGGAGFTISHEATGTGECWAELLTGGLTFDCHGLAPGQSAPAPPAATLLGLASAPEGEALSLQPGPHIAAGAALPPVLRGLLGVAIALARLPQVRAVCWHPSACAMEPGYFIRIAEDWLGGGPFPALGLIALHRQDSGLLVSTGLAFFTGQELAIDPDRRWQPTDMAQLAIRLIDDLIAVGTVTEPRAFTFPEHPAVLAIPVERGTVLRVRRQHAD
jgi:hypothetical protein